MVDRRRQLLELLEDELGPLERLVAGDELAQELRKVLRDFAGTANAMGYS